MSIDSSEYRALSNNIFQTTSKALDYYNKLSNTLRMQMLNAAQTVQERQLSQQKLNVESQIRMGKLKESYFPTQNDKRLALFLNALNSGVKGYVSGRGEQAQKNYINWLNSLSTGASTGTSTFGTDYPMNDYTSYPVNRTSDLNPYNDFG